MSVTSLEHTTPTNTTELPKDIYFGLTFAQTISLFAGLAAVFIVIVAVAFLVGRRCSNRFSVRPPGRRRSLPPSFHHLSPHASASPHRGMFSQGLSQGLPIETRFGAIRPRSLLPRNRGTEPTQQPSPKCIGSPTTLSSGGSQKPNTLSMLAVGPSILSTGNELAVGSASTLPRCKKPKKKTLFQKIFGTRDNAQNDSGVVSANSRVSYVTYGGEVSDLVASTIDTVIHEACEDSSKNKTSSTTEEKKQKVRKPISSRKEAATDVSSKAKNRKNSRKSHEDSEVKDTVYDVYKI